jgi:PEP-CTERM motif
MVPAMIRRISLLLLACAITALAGDLPNMYNHQGDYSGIFSDDHDDHGSCRDRDDCKDPAPVPEPGTWILAGGGLLVCGLMEMCGWVKREQERRDREDGKTRG